MTEQEYITQEYINALAEDERQSHLEPMRANEINYTPLDYHPNREWCTLFEAVEGWHGFMDETQSVIDPRCTLAEAIEGWKSVFMHWGENDD